LIMKKYIYYLQDSPNYPNTIMANSKDEVKKLILENVPDESQILKIIEASDSSNNEPKAVYAEPDDYANSQDFFNDVIKAGGKVGEKIAQTPVGSSSAVSAQPAPVKYFEEGGVQFKLENNKVFKRSWVEANGDDSEFRIISAKTGKVIGNDKFKLERLVWVEI